MGNVTRGTRLWTGENQRTDSEMDHAVDVTYGEYPDIRDLGFKDNQLSSLTVAPFTKVIIYQNFNFSGRSVEFIGPRTVNKLTDYSMNDKVSSIKVIRMDPPSDQILNCCNNKDSTWEKCGEYSSLFAYHQYCPADLTRACCNDAEFRSGVGAKICKDIFDKGDPASKCPGLYKYHCCDKLGDDPKCQNWFRENPTVCDRAANFYCGENPDDPICSCINSPARSVGVANPLCVDQKCLNTGYVTANMRNTPCPPMVNCDTQTALKNAGVVLSDNTTIVQNCGNTGVPTGTTGNTTGAPSGTTDTPSGTIGNTSGTMGTLNMMFILIIFVILAILGYVVYARGFTDPTTSP